MAAPQKCRWPPDLPARLIYWTFDRESKRQDYRSFVEDYRDRAAHRQKAANIWAHAYAAKSMWGVLPPDIRGALVTALLKLILRG
jgi:hypothetical protein